MNAEITDIKNQNGLVCFDAQCGFCVNLARRSGPLLQRHGFALVPLQAPWVKDRLAKSDEELRSEMWLIAPRGRVYGGVDALAEIARQIWWAKPVYWLSGVPLVEAVLRSGYRWVARNRSCLGGSCSVPASPNRSVAGALGWVAALLPTAFAVSLGRALPAWVGMWAIALALFWGAKWVTMTRWLRAGNAASPARLLAFTFLWPGMDARAFLGRTLVFQPRPGEWAGAGAKAFSGAALVWIGAARTQPMHPIAAGWVGMVGLVLLLHFGLFHLLALIWRAVGIDARPIMRSPAASTSLRRFWGGGWNAAFTELMHENLFKPLSRRAGPPGALFLVFLISGALHELVISVPARGGYGLPTAYFVLQGLALRFERSQPGQKLGLGAGLRGWCFVALVVGAPAFWLFHPIFIRHVILPMLHAIGAT